ncbi:MAG TPA: hypothetical protein VE890_17340 [Thermoguttaceae bacterium]|nr:hypothetical protein [Thermoguttaceae bacterium]
MNRLSFRCLAVLTLLVVWTTAARCAEQATVLIPATDTVPNIDGQIDEAEWADAAVISGFIQPQSSLLTPPGGEIYVKHDREKLYLAFRSKLLPGMVPTRRYRRRDEPVYMDSHQIELWLTPPIEDSKTWSYQFIGNAYGAIFDNLQHPELGSTSLGWDGNWDFANHFEKGQYWDAELSIPARDLNLSSIEPGQVWRGMVGIAWPQRAWPFTGGWYKNVPLHAQWIMGGDAEAVRLAGIDRLLNNELDLELTVAAGRTGGTFKADVQIEGIHQTATVSLRPNERKPI